MSAEFRLATYGSLAPGAANHDQLSGLSGSWRTGTIRGRLLDAGWGSPIGFPGLVLDDHAFEIPVALFESDELPQHWERLDAFEGEGYRRTVARVSSEGEALDAYIYALSGHARPTV